MSIDIPNQILELLPAKWPQVSVVSNAILQRVPLSAFYFSEKTDGVHANILIYNSNIYDVTHKDSIKFVSKIDYSEMLILDTEFYKGKYYIFDVYYANSEYVGDEHFVERLAHLPSLPTSLSSMFVLKKFAPIPNLEYLLSFIKNEKNPETGNDIDGVILQRIDLPYIYRKEPTVLKLKPRSLMTVDFLLKYNNSEDNFKLYTIGSCFDYMNSLTSIPKKEKYIYDNTHQRFETSKLKTYPKSMFILFDSPFIPNLSVYKVVNNYNMKGYFARVIPEIDQLISQFVSTPKSFDNKIVEMSLTLDNKWVPIRIRDDKLMPNGFRVAQDVVSLIFDPIKSNEEVYFQRNISASTDVQDYVHSINQIYRKFVIEEYISPRAHFSTVIDLCGGRGADLYNLYANGISNFIAIDGDSTALKQYVDRAYSLKNKFKKDGYVKLLNATKYDTKPKAFTINALNYMLSSKVYNEIENDLKSRPDYRGSARFVLMNFAIHYLCKSTSELTKLSNFVYKMLESEGYFIFTYYDGDRILENAKEEKSRDVKTKKETTKLISKVGPFSIEIVENKKDYTIAKMPLVTIQDGDNFYREEPLVHQRTLEKISSKFVLVKDVNLYDEVKEVVDKLHDPEHLLDYYRLVHVRIYKK